MVLRRGYAVDDWGLRGVGCMRACTGLSSDGAIFGPSLDQYEGLVACFRNRMPFWSCV